MHELTKRRVVGTFAAVAAVALVGCSVESARWALEARAVRKGLPTPDAVERIFGASILQWPARRLLQRAGTQDYDVALHKAMFAPSVLEDTDSNRAELREILLKVDAEERRELLVSYPFKPEVDLLPLMQASLQDGSFELLPIIARIEDAEATRVLRNWVDINIVTASSAQVFLDSAPYALSVDVPGGEACASLLERFWSNLPRDQRSALLRSLAGRMPRPNACATSISSWAIRSALMEGKDADPLWARLLAVLSTSEAERRAAMEALSTHTSLQSAEESAATIVENAEPEELEKHWRWALGTKRQPTGLALGVFRVLVGKREAAAKALTEKLAKNLIERNPDSSLRKGVIVLLARGHSPLAAKYFDEAFTGRARRTEKFGDTEQYLYGSRATSSYIELSGHDYLETGKTWPPAGSSRDDDEMLQNWATFIGTYPWFPGVDDAVYRLSYLQFKRGLFQEALETARGYFERAPFLPDADATPFVTRVLRQLAVHPTWPVDAPELRMVREIVQSPLAKLAVMSGDATALENALAGLAANRALLHAFQTTKVQVDVAISALRAFKAESAPSVRLGRLRKRLEALPDAPYWALYGWAIDQYGDYEPDEFALAAIGTVGSWIAAQLRTVIAAHGSALDLSASRTPEAREAALYLLFHFRAESSHRNSPMAESYALMSQLQLRAVPAEYQPQLRHMQDLFSGMSTARGRVASP